MPKPTRRASSRHPGLPVVIGSVAFLCRSGDPEQGALPKRILIATWGANEARADKRTFYVGAQTLKQLASEQSLRGWDTVSLDYEHQSVPGSPTYKEDPRPMAAHGRVEVVEGEGIYYLAERYTPNGLQNAANYPDVSGCFIVDSRTQEVIAIHSVALCQHGQVMGAEFVEAIAASIGSGQAGSSPSAMTAVLEQCRTLLGLPDTALADDVAEGLAELISSQSQSQTQTDNPMAEANPKPAVTDPSEARMSDMEKTLEGILGAVGTLSTTVTTMANGQVMAAHNQAVESEFALACSAGKKVPEALKAKDAAGKYLMAAAQVKDVLAVIPVTESVAFLTPEHLAASARGGLPPATEQAEAEVRAALGITKESWDKGVPLLCGTAPAKGTESRFSAKS